MSGIITATLICLSVTPGALPGGDRHPCGDVEPFEAWARSCRWPEPAAPAEPGPTPAPLVAAPEPTEATAVDPDDAPPEAVLCPAAPAETDPDPAVLLV